MHAGFWLGQKLGVALKQNLEKLAPHLCGNPQHINGQIWPQVPQPRD